MTHRLNQAALNGIHANSVTAQEVADIARDSVGSPWTLDGCTDFVYAVTYLAGAPFYDLRGVQAFVNGDPLMPEDTSTGFAVPHSAQPNQGGDGWSIVPHGSTASAIIATLHVGDVVRAYRVAGEEPTSSDTTPGHEFIVSRIDASGVWAVDNTHPGDHAIWEHLIDPNWSYLSLPDHVYISRLDETFPLPDDYEGNPQTTGTVSVDGGQVAGNIERPGDADWFKMQLVQGHAYTFHVESGGPPQIAPFLANPFLALYDSNGQFIASDDNSGGGLNSQLTYTAQYTGVYFVSASSATVGGTGTYRIWDPPATGTGSVSINDFSISEGNSGAKIATFTVTRTGGTAAFDISYFTSDGGAKIADGDYIATSGTLHFNANVNTQTISVTINGDVKPESDEAFFVNLSGATNGASVSDNLGIGIITDDDATDTTAPTFSNDNPLSVAISASGTITSSLLSVNDNVSTATQLTYTVVTAPSHGSLTKSGSPTASFTQADIDNGLIAYREDGSAVSSDSFTFNVSDAAGNHTANTPFQFQIVNPQTPTLSLSPATVTHSEGNAGTTTDFTFLVTLVGTSNQQITAQWFTTWSSSFDLADFTGPYNGNLTFDPGGSKTQTITMHVLGDNVVEPDESFVVHLINSSGAQINASASLATGIALNDDAGDLTVPVLGNNTALPVALGNTATVSSNYLSVDDPYDSHAQLTYTVTSSPAHGMLLKNGLATSSFTQADIDNNLIKYQENGSIASSDFFSFTVSDPAGNQASSTLFQFAIGGATPLTVLGDSAMWDAADFQLLNTFTNGGGNPPPTLYYYGPVTANGFTLANLSRSDFAFTSWDSRWASTFGDFYDGLRVLDVPLGTNGPSTIRLQRQDGAFFTPEAIDLDTSSAQSGVSVTFTGLRFDNTTVTQVFSLDATHGFQTFTLNGNFANLRQLDFTPSANVSFDNLVLNPNAALNAIESFGSTSLTQVASSYFLYASGTLTGPELKSGANIVAGQYGDWVPIGGEQISGGNYEVAWKSPSTGHYTVWSLDSNGNYVTSLVGEVAGSNAVLESLETSFQQDLNGDGFTGVPATVIESHGSTSLVQSGSNYFLYANGTSTGPELKNGGANIVAGQYGDWVPIGSEQISGGNYEVAWKSPSTGHYTVWSVDGSGNYVTSLVGEVAGSNATLESLETSFQQDLNGDGFIGVPATVIESFGLTSLTRVGSNYFLYANGTSTGPELKNGGANIVAGQYGGWAPIGGEQISGGNYEVAWKDAGTGHFTVWTIDGNGNYISSPIGEVTGTDNTLKSLEAAFQQDLNGDGVIGTRAREDFGGDGHSDVLWQNNDGTVAIWDSGQSGSAHTAAAAGVIASSWHIAGTGDFDGNGHSDILWQNDNGMISIWDNGQIGAAHIIANAGVVASSWHVVGTGDFDGNGHSDILWQNDNGMVSIWDNGQIGGAHVIANAGVVASSWHIAGTGDFDGNGHGDILWRNDNGTASIWDNGQIGGAHVIANAGVVANGWHIAGTGDFDGNSHSDLLWQNDNGMVSIWDNGQIGSAHIIAAAGVVASSWHIAGTGDFDGNGHDDILWRNDNGSVSIWDNGQIGSARIIANSGVVASSWHIV